MEMINRLAVALKDTDTTPVSMIVFGSVRAYPAAHEAMRRIFGGVDWPVTWVEGNAGADQPIAGMQTLAFSADRVDRITLKGQVVGSVFAEGAVRHCLLGGLGPDANTASCLEQFPQTLANLEIALHQAGFTMGDIVRTWFYLDELLAWYGAFNKARTQAYAKIRFRSGSLPASTGISGPNPAGTALVGGATAASQRAVGGSRFPLAMSRACLWQLVQPGHGDWVLSRPASFNLRHSQHCPRRRNLMAGQRPPPNRSDHGSRRSHIGIARLWFFGHHPRHRLFQT
jgi:enamine deaminase RidA (YjgF/YER057c/UK114 family)